MKGLIFTYLLCYGGAFISLFQPFVGLLIYVCFAIIKPEALWDWSVPQGNYSRIVALALLVGWSLKGFGNWQFGRARTLVMALGAFWLWMVLGAVQAEDPEVAWEAVEGLSKIVLPFVVGMTVVDSVQKVRQLAWVILLSQGYVAFEFNLSYLEGRNRITEAPFAGLDNNSMAIALVASTGLGFFLGLHAQRWWQKLLAFGMAACCAHAVLFSFSRGGMLALIITGVVSFFVIPKKPKHYAIFLLAILLGLRLAGPEVRARFSTTFVDAEERDGSAQSRLDLWGNCWDSMLRYPIFGRGPNHWPLIVEEYGWPRGKAAHSLWMQVGAENGFPGLLFLVTFYVLCIARLWPYMRQRQLFPDPWFHDCPRLVCASLIGFAVAAQFVSVWGLELPYYIALVGAGTLKLISLSSTSPGAAGPDAAIAEAPGPIPA
jgi:probable O-glycosylation ligase (exosortase A-associated)